MAKITCSHRLGGCNVQQLQLHKCLLTPTTRLLTDHPLTMNGTLAAAQTANMVKR